MMLPVTQGLGELSSIVDIIKNADKFADRIAELEAIHQQINDTYEVVMTLEEAKEVRAAAADIMDKANKKDVEASERVLSRLKESEDAFAAREKAVLSAEQSLEAARNTFNKEANVLRTQLNTEINACQSTERNYAQGLASLQIQAEEYRLKQMELNEKMAKIDSVMKAVA